MIALEAGSFTPPAARMKMVSAFDLLSERLDASGSTSPSRVHLCKRSEPSSTLHAFDRDGSRSKREPPNREEIYIRLAEPLQDYTITPWRRLDPADIPRDHDGQTPIRPKGFESDLTDMCDKLNHKLVFPTLLAAPYPYTMAHAESFMRAMSNKHRPWQDVLLASAASAAEAVQAVQHMTEWPFSVIRYEPLSPTASSSGSRPGRVVGHCALRAIDDESSDPSAVRLRFDERKWEFGYDLHPDHGGRKLMSAAISAQIACVEALAAITADGYALPSAPSPIAGPKSRFCLSVMTFNTASLKTAQKAGFQIVAEKPSFAGHTYGTKDANGSVGVIPKEHRGKQVDLYIMER